MIVVTIRERTVAASRRAMAAVGRAAGAVELRLDDVAGGEWESLLAGSEKPVIVTCRGHRQGGGFAGSEDQRLGILRRALQLGAQRVDVEVDTPAAALLGEYPGTRLLLSLHDFEPGAATLSSHLRRLMGAAPRGLPLKLAYTPRLSSECLAGRELLRHVDAKDWPVVLVCMGDSGVPGRLLAPSWGSAWAYAAADGAPPAAPGQLSLFEMVDLYDTGSIGAATRLTGLLGHPVQASLSPWMHNRAARAAGLDARYLLFPERDAADVVLNAAAWNLTGLSVTHPHKETVLPWLEQAGTEVRACGAANTLTFRHGLTRGDNTDAGAALETLRRALPQGQEMRGLRLAILGAGGAARALGWAASQAGVRVVIHSRNKSRGEVTARVVSGTWRHLDELQAGDYDALANATPVGTWPGIDQLPVPEEALGGKLVFDLIANPAETRLLAAARAQGLATQGGVEMLVAQGERQFQLWHGQPAPPGVFLAAAWEALRRCSEVDAREPGL